MLDDPQRGHSAGVWFFSGAAAAPFGGGAHKCIGMFFGEMEVKAVLHQLLLRFRWSVPDGYEMKQDFTTLPMPADGLPVTLAQL